jgi:ribosomal protein S18 acetylase RimI-like enzyme
METSIKLITVDQKNLDKYPQCICFINPKHKYYNLKIEWLKKRFNEGLKIKVLSLENENKIIGFIEYIDGKNCWRAVEAKGYMFIHCLWINGKKYRNKGLAKKLIDEVEKDAHKMNGVAIITSDNAFMVKKNLFLKYGYSILEENGKDQLLVKQFKKNALLPKIKNNSKLENNAGLKIIYSKQCPWVARFIEEIKNFLEKEKIKIEIKELKTAKDAQNSVSIYSVFNLLYNNKLLADRYISLTRFKNILFKEIEKKGRQIKK